MTPWRALWALAMALALSGCAVLGGAAPALAPAAGAERGADAPRVEVRAPSELKTLLERYLDLVRLGGLARENTIDDSEWTRLIDATPAQVRELLQTEGYFSPQVRVQRSTGGGPVTVQVDVEPGPRTLVARVDIEFEGELERAAAAGDPLAAATVADLRRAWALREGEAFRNRDWNDAKAAALSRLRAAGYVAAAWSGTGAEVRPETQRARLFLVADSGPLFRFGDLQIDGLLTHGAQTVRNLAGVAVGTPITEALLLDYQERLQKAGLFESVSVTLDPDPARAAAADIRVSLREAPLQVYTLGLGISANVGPRASVEHTYRRVFGWAATARNKVEWGKLRQAWDGEISTHPGEAMVRHLVGGAVENLETSTDTVLSQRLRLGRAQEVGRGERLYFVEAERSSRTTGGLRSNTLALSLNAHALWRRLDSVVLPTDGFTLSLQGGVGRSHGTDAESGPFTRLYARATAYRPIGQNWYGQARLELGQVIKRAAVAVPDSQLFRAGGDDSVRGYGYRSLGPIVAGAVAGGSALFTGSVELARPLSPELPALWGAAFVDAGGAAATFGDLRPVLGLGVGLRWRSPVGPLRVDWAYGQEIRSWRLHFSVGIAF
jgi:translocation and assembly module TamA